MKQSIPNKFLITGCARSGTSLMTILMSYFKELKINPTIETPPTLFKDLDAFKTPQRNDGLIWNDFIQPKKSLIDFINEGVKLIVMLRDGRDVVVSRHKSEPSSYWCGPKRWINSIEELLSALALDKKEMIHIVRYENLTIDFQSEMKELQKFVGLELDSNYINFHNEHQKANQITWAMNGIRPVSPNSGMWQMEEHQIRINEVLNDNDSGYRFKELLKKTGYLE